MSSLTTKRSFIRSAHVTRSCWTAVSTLCPEALSGRQISIQQSTTKRVRSALVSKLCAKSRRVWRAGTRMALTKYGLLVSKRETNVSSWWLLEDWVCCLDGVGWVVGASMGSKMSGQVANTLVGWIRRNCFDWLWKSCSESLFPELPSSATARLGYNPLQRMILRRFISRSVKLRLAALPACSLSRSCVSLNSRSRMSDALLSSLSLQPSSSSFSIFVFLDDFRCSRFSFFNLRHLSSSRSSSYSYLSRSFCSIKRWSRSNCSNWRLSFDIS